MKNKPFSSTNQPKHSKSSPSRRNRRGYVIAVVFDNDVTTTVLYGSLQKAIDDNPSVMPSYRTLLYHFSKKGVYVSNKLYITRSLIK